MAAKTTSQNLTELANQLFAAAASATGTDRETLLGMAKRKEAEAAELRTEEAAKDRADREFWASHRPMNWVS